MFIITQLNTFNCNPEETLYLGWQNPAWDEDGYFWTSKDTIKDIISYGSNTRKHPFLFRTEKDAWKFANKLGIKKFSIKSW